jgi:hypothetical protein
MFKVVVLKAITGATEVDRVKYARGCKIKMKVEPSTNPNPKVHHVK